MKMNALTELENIQFALEAAQDFEQLVFDELESWYELYAKEGAAFAGEYMNYRHSLVDHLNDGITDKVRAAIQALQALIDNQTRTPKEDQ